MPKRQHAPEKSRRRKRQGDRQDHRVRVIRSDDDTESVLFSLGEIDIVPGIGGLRLVQNIIRTRPAPRRLRHAATSRRTSEVRFHYLLLAEIGPRESRSRARVKMIPTPSVFLCLPPFNFRYLERIRNRIPIHRLIRRLSLEITGETFYAISFFLFFFF